MAANFDLKRFEHPATVLEKYLDLKAQGHEVALAILVGTEGGATRELGSLMAVTADRETIGSIVGGCIEAEVVTQATEALMQQKPKRLRYGGDSPIIDLRLPCDGTVEILVLPNLSAEKAHRWHSELNNRRPVLVGFGECDVAEIISTGIPSQPGQLISYIEYQPEIVLRIVGTGLEGIALAELAIKSGFRVILQSINPMDRPERAAMDRIVFQHLKSAASLNETCDDRWTALIVMVHDMEWEVSLLQLALEGDCFYIGAVGSKASRRKRDQELESLGARSVDLKRVHGPIGLVPSMRSPSTLAISILAEVIDVFRKRPEPLIQSWRGGSHEHNG